MASLPTYACITLLLLSLGATASAAERTRDCPTGKLGDVDFQEALSGPHDGVLVRLDVDADLYLRAAREAPSLSDSARETLSRQGSARLLEAKRQRLRDSRFSIYRNLDFGQEVVILVKDMGDVCELASLPQVSMIWVNRIMKLEPLAFRPASTSSGVLR
jgi:hypothetical protein